MATIRIRNVDKDLLVRQIELLLDLAYSERKKAKARGDHRRGDTARELEAILDMLMDAEVYDE